MGLDPASVLSPPRYTIGFGLSFQGKTHESAYHYLL